MRSLSQIADDAYYWDPQIGEINPSDFEGVDVIVNLAGDNIASSRWTVNKKRTILHSRVNGTRLLCEAIEQMKKPPKVLINASAVGYYGDTGHRLVNEDEPSGKGFLPSVCTEWEAAADISKEKGVRIVKLRIGLVLSRKGGVLKKLLTPFKMGAGGIVGSGKQYMSWITLEDLVAVIQHVISNETIEGPLNAVAPNPVNNREFTKTLGKVLHRPTLLPLPAFMARLLLGEMADELLLSGTRVDDGRLLGSGYQFRHPDLKEALQSLLG